MLIVRCIKSKFIHHTILFWIVFSFSPISVSAQDDWTTWADGQGKFRKADATEWQELKKGDTLIVGDYVQSSQTEELKLNCQFQGQLVNIILDADTQLRLSEGCSGAASRQTGWIRHIAGKLGALGSWLFGNPYPPPRSGASRGDKPERTTLITPRWGYIFEQRPRVEWMQGRDAKPPYHLRILDTAGQVVYEDASIETTVTTMPEGVPALEVGQQYYIHLTSANFREEDVEAASEFVVADPALRAAFSMAKDSLAAVYDDPVLGELAFAAYLIEAEFFEEARQQLLTLDPGIPTVQRMTMQFYKEFGPLEMIP